jgi:uncharacterized membrane protein SirB2
MYETLKWLHVTAVIVSGSGFAARAALMLAGSPLLHARFVRAAPHVIDTVLLAAALAMAFMARLSPLAHPWLAAKIGGLLVYIVLGAVALRYGRSRRSRVLALIGAMLTFAYIVGTALTRDALWPLRSG